MNTIEKNIENAAARLLKLFSATDAKDILVRHEVGCTVLELKNEDNYGADGIERVANRLGRGYGRSTLYRYRDVAEAWSRGQIERIVELRNAKGVGLSWSHLECIAAAPEADREHFLRHALEGSLDVRDLRAAIAKKRHADKGEPDPRSQEAEDDEFLGRSVIPKLAEYLSEVEDETRKWEQRLAADVGVDAADLLAAEREMLDEALVRMARVGAVMQSLASRLNLLLTVVAPAPSKLRQLPPAEARSV